MKLTEIAAYARFDATLALIIYLMKFRGIKVSNKLSSSRRIVKKMLVDESGPQQLSMAPYQRATAIIRVQQKKIRGREKKERSKKEKNIPNRHGDA